LSAASTKNPSEDFEPRINGDRGLQWKDLVSKDMEEMIRRLRKVECPEETIKDIILNAVNKEYRALTRSRVPDYFGNRQYWESHRTFDPERMKQMREAQKKQAELAKEKSVRLKDLLGVDPEKEGRQQQGLPEQTYYSFLASRVEFLPENKREAALQYLQDFEEKAQEMYRNIGPFWDAEARAEQSKLEADRLAGLAQYLTPAELREYELRNSQMASQLMSEINGLSMSREQYEALFDLRKKYGNSIYNYGDIETKADRDRVTQNQKDMKAEISQTLGTDFEKQYERTTDYSFQQLTRLAQRNEMPADTAGKVFDMKDSYEAGAKTLKDDPSMTPDQRAQALQQLRTEAQDGIKAMLGEKLYQKYVDNGGWWIRNLTVQTH
jgi:hypothetical protein